MNNIWLIFVLLLLNNSCGCEGRKCGRCGCEKEYQDCPCEKKSCECCEAVKYETPKAWNSFPTFQDEDSKDNCPCNK